MYRLKQRVRALGLLVCIFIGSFGGMMLPSSAYASASTNVFPNEDPPPSCPRCPRGGGGCPCRNG